MTHIMQTNTKGFDELVFDHRNQAYGAYVLRRDYPKHALKSLLIGVAIIASILAIPYLANYFDKVKIQQKVVPYDNHPTLKDLKTDKKDDVKPPKSNIKPPSGNPNIAGIPLVVIDIVEPIEDSVDYKSLNPGKFDPNGDPTILDQGEQGGIDSLIGEKKKTYPTVGLDKIPTFPGGEEALHQFLGENLVYPEYAKRIGVEGKVYVTFVVDEFGNVVNIATPRPIGGGCDEEALRVVQLMPRWEPGIWAGHPVRVAYQLPISFKLGN